MEAMNSKDETLAAIRGHILGDPAAILEDKDMVNALLKAHSGGRRSRNVVDLRTVLVEKLEDRLVRLEDTHRTVIAAAYENLAGTNQVHRATLAIMNPLDFDGFLAALAHDVANILSIDVIRLCLESPAAEAGQSLGPKGELRDLIIALPRHGVNAYVSDNRNIEPRQITLRQCAPDQASVFGNASTWIQSEALMKLDLGDGRLPGLLAFGSEDPHRFNQDQGTDLLTFFSGAFESIMRRWLA